MKELIVCDGASSHIQFVRTGHSLAAFLFANAFNGALVKSQYHRLFVEYDQLMSLSTFDLAAIMTPPSSHLSF
jgi:hypothetical protein